MINKLISLKYELGRHLRLKEGEERFQEANRNVNDINRFFPTVVNSALMSNSSKNVDFTNIYFADNTEKRRRATNGHCQK